MTICLTSLFKLNGQVIQLITDDGMPIVKTYIKKDSSSIKYLGVYTSDYINLNEIKSIVLDNVFIESKGYQGIYVAKTGSMDTIQIKLRSAAHILNTVLISSSKNEKKYQDIPNSLIKIQPYLIENRNNTELTEVINQIPSVNIVDNQASIRGGSGWSYGSGSRVMVTMDGLPVLSGDANQVQWQFLDMQHIKSIEVLKGASSVLYGSSALNGSINIQTEDAPDSIKGQVNAYFGFYDKPNKDSLLWTSNSLLKYGINSFVTFKKKKMDYTFTSLNVVDNGYRMAEETNRSKLGARLKYHINDSTHIGLNVKGMYTSGSTFLLWESGGYGFTALDSSFNTNITKRLTIDPSITMQRKHVKHQFLGRYFVLDNDIFQMDTLSQQSNSSTFAYGEYRALTDDFLWNSQLTYGLSASQSKTNSPLFQGVQQASNIAGYVQLERRIRKWFASAGLRYEQFTLNQRKEGKPVIKLGLTYNPKRYTILRANYGEGFRFPSIAESFIATSVGPVTIFPNENLNPESAWNMEMGIKQGYRWKKFTGYVDVAAFYSEIRDMIEFTFASWDTDVSLSNLFGLGFKSQNVGLSIIQGVDITLVSKYLLKRGAVQFMGGYTLSDARAVTPEKVFAVDNLNKQLSYNTTSQNPEDRYLKYRSLHTFKADIQLDEGQYSFGLSSRYNSFMENIDKAFVDFPINLFVPGVEEARQQTKKGNWVLDLRISKKWERGFKTSAIINNLANSIFMERPADIQAPRYFMFQVVKDF